MTDNLKVKLKTESGLEYTAIGDMNEGVKIPCNSTVLSVESMPLLNTSTSERYDEETLHEALHMCSFLADAFDEQVCQNKTVEKNIALVARADAISEEMYQLYQDIAKKFR